MLKTQQLNSYHETDSCMFSETFTEMHHVLVLDTIPDRFRTRVPREPSSPDTRKSGKTCSQSGVSIIQSLTIERMRLSASSVVSPSTALLINITVNFVSLQVLKVALECPKPEQVLPIRKQCALPWPLSFYY